MVNWRVSSHCLGTLRILLGILIFQERRLEKTRHLKGTLPCSVFHVCCFKTKSSNSLFTSVSFMLSSSYLAFLFFFSVFGVLIQVS